MKRNMLLPLLLGATAVAFGLALGPSEAHAVELHWDPVSNAWVRTPTVIVGHTVGSPVRNPRRYYVNVVPPTRVRTVPVVVPQRRVTVHVRQAAPPPPPPVRVVVDHGRRDSAPTERDPYATDGLVIAGAGVGGVFLFGDGVTHAALGYKLHLGLAIDAAEFALRATLVPDAGEVAGPTGLPTESALYAVGASFNYRFLDRAVVHPVFGAGLETLILDPREGDTGTAFAVTGRAGIEFAYPISDGALALGIDLTGHLPFGVTDQYAADAVAMLDFGAYLDYRF
ncbi:MAG: hypothetical protein JRH11_11320 [Deltaproteobacteria bacterium]|nr:hypothetical protein [Deltaproteobacteria bacterium]